MEPANRNWIVRQGSDWDDRELIVQETAEGPVVDLTGCTARSTFRKSLGGAAISTLTTENGGIVITAAEGKIQLVQGHAVTAAYDLSGMRTKTIVEYTRADGRQIKGTGPTGVHDLELVWPSGRVQQLIFGEVCFPREATT